MTYSDLSWWPNHGQLFAGQQTNSSVIVATLALGWQRLSGATLRCSGAVQRPLFKHTTGLPTLGGMPVCSNHASYACWVAPVPDVGRGRGAQTEEVYDAVVVCNGHYAKVRVPNFPGQDGWPGRQMHSHNYRRPDAFKGAQVLVVGVSASGEDISREIADVADQVRRGVAWSSKPRSGF